MKPTVSNFVTLAVVVAVVIVVFLAATKESREKAAAQRRREETRRLEETPGTPEWAAIEESNRKFEEQKRATREAAAARDRDLIEKRIEFETHQLELERRARDEGRYIDDWQSAERAAEWVMRERLGFADAHKTTGGADGGIDVTAKSAVAQVKRQTAKVQRPAIQNLKGAAAGRKSLFFAVPPVAGENPYTRQAVEWADANGVALFALDTAGEPTPINGLAHKIEIRSRDAAEEAAQLRVVTMARAAAVGNGSKVGERCRCGQGEMVIRNRKGDRQRFLGCSNFPECRHTAPLPSRRTKSR